jgi:Sulfotransferase family
MDLKPGDSYATAGERRLRVIYIAGTSHSGSTLLNLMLNAHPEIFSVGEALHLNRKLTVKNIPERRYAPCTCGAPSLWKCEFWSRVDEYTQKTIGKSLIDLNMLDQRPLESTQAPNALVFKAISNVSGKKFVVDSSKLPRRLSHLMCLDEINVYPVHLIRDPKGQIHSVRRKHGGFLKHIFRYELVHSQIHRILRFVPHSVVRYEDLVVDPEPTLRSILEPLGLTFDPRQLAWAEAVKHDVAGNHIRFNDKSELVLDETWKRNLSSIQRIAINVGTLFSRRSMLRTGYVHGKRLRPVNVP